MPVALFTERIVASQGGITYFGGEMALGLSSGFDLGNRPEKEDVYLDLAGLARKFDLGLAKLPHKPKRPWAVCFATPNQG